MVLPGAPQGRPARCRRDRVWRRCLCLAAVEQNLADVLRYLQVPDSQAEDPNALPQLYVADVHVSYAQLCCRH